MGNYDQSRFNGRKYKPGTEVKTMSMRCPIWFSTLWSAAAATYLEPRTGKPMSRTQWIIRELNKHAVGRLKSKGIYDKFIREHGKPPL